MGVECHALTQLHPEHGIVGAQRAICGHSRGAIAVERGGRVADAAASSGDALVTTVDYWWGTGPGGDTAAVVGGDMVCGCDASGVFTCRSFVPYTTFN